MKKDATTQVSHGKTPKSRSPRPARRTESAGTIRSVSLNRLCGHPDNPNRMARAAFGRLLRNIELTGCYEPLIVRPHPNKARHFQIINGHHRARALRKLGRTHAQVIVWNVDDQQTDVLLGSLNRLGGSDVLARKAALLKRLNKKRTARELAGLLPESARNVERIARLKLPTHPAPPQDIPTAMVFFVNSEQQQVIERAMSRVPADRSATRAERKSTALAYLAEQYLDNNRFGENHART